MSCAYQKKCKHLNTLSPPISLRKVTSVYKINQSTTLINHEIKAKKTIMQACSRIQYPEREYVMKSINIFSCSINMYMILQGYLL